ncbi:MAG: hypothetical protein ABIG60_01235 [Patescibacteria group bacterium]
MTENEKYWKGFRKLVVQDPGRFVRLVKDGEVSPDGKEPTDRIYLELVELGK